MYLVDTSVWIDFLRGQETAWTVALETCLKEGTAGICDVIFAEICFGARDEQQLKRYQKHLSLLPFFSLPENWHQDAVAMGLLLRKKGHKPFIADMRIAMTALEHSLPLLSQDKDFIVYRDLFGLELYSTRS